MSSLFFVRHAQASFFEENYDRLSSLGKEQARSLANFWTETGVAFDEIITGPRERQRHTAEIVTEAYRAAGLPCPESREEPDFDEHQLEQLIRHHRKKLSLPELEAGLTAARATGSIRDLQRRFSHVLEAVADLWLTAGPGTEAVESWQQFGQRVRRGLSGVRRAAGHARRVAVFTSAGVIGVVLQEALGCSDLQGMRLSWRLRNASLTEFVFSGERFTLDSFNGLPHLQDRRTWTHI